MNAPICVDSLSNPLPYPEALEAMLPFYNKLYGNPFCPHDLGQELLPHLEQARKALYALLEAPPGAAFVFTSGQSESIAQVLKSVIASKRGPHHIVSFATEVAPLIFTLSHLEKEGHTITLVDNLQSLENALTDKTTLLSISSSEPLLGLMRPIRECADLCHERGILFHVDVSYTLARDIMPLNEIDYLTFGGEHIFAPRGTGALFAKKGAPLSPLIFGEGEDDLHRGGTFNVPLFIALGKAAEFTALNRKGLILEQTRLRDLFEKRLEHAIPDIHIFFRDRKRLPHVSLIAIPHIRNELLLFMLNKRGVFASMGGGTFQPIEEQLKGDPLAQNALSFSFPRDITEADIDALVRTLIDVVEALRPLSEGLV
jgi:cysteine desulfurase